jgi:SAM-dependent methyltransferase
MSVDRSVCVALSVRNGKRYLAEAIESVLGQQGVELELRIYDNGSSDGSLELAGSYLADPRVTLAQNPEGTTYYGSLNRALAETGAPFFAPFACDDLMLPGNLDAKVGVLAESEAVFAHSLAQVIDAEGAVQRIWCDFADAPALSERGAFFPQMAPVNPMVLMAAVCRTDALRASGGFDVRLEYCCDWLALLRLALRGRVATLHTPLVSYRRHAEAGSNHWHGGSAFVGELVSALALAVADEAFPASARPAIPGLFAGCLSHCARELGHAHVHRTDPDGNSAYAVAARALELLPGDERLRQLLERLLADAGLAPLAPGATLVAAAPSLPEEAVRLLERAEELVGAGLAASLRVGCLPGESARIAALFEEGSSPTPRFPVELAPTDDPGSLFIPGCIALLPAGRPALIADAEARGVAALAYDLASPLEQPWDRTLAAIQPPRPAPAGTAADIAGPREPSPALAAFTAQFPYERETILEFVQRTAASLPAGARVLDLGAGEAPYRELFAHVDYLTSDWENSVHPGARAVDVVGSADALPLPDRCFDAIVNTQMLEHVAEPAAVLREIHRLLIPGGRFFLTVPLVWELHEEPYDFYRYTPHGLSHLLTQAGFVDVAIEPRNDCFTTIAQLMRNVGAAVGSRPDGLDPQRAQAVQTLRQLADIVASFAHLDARRILPLGYSVTASRVGTTPGRSACGLEGARSAIVLALADEVVDEPELLSQYAAALPEGADVSLALLASARTDLEATLAPALGRAGLDGTQADIVALPGGIEPALLGRLAPLAHGLLSLREPPPSLAGLPSLRTGTADELLATALSPSR